MNTLIYNGRIINPATSVNDIGYIIIKHRKVEVLELSGIIDTLKVEELRSEHSIDKVIDALITEDQARKLRGE